MISLAIIAFGETDGRFLTAAGDCLWRIYGVDVRTLPPLPDPAYALDAARRQYSSSRLLAELLAHAPPDAGRILGVTERDLFIPMLSYVFGHAQFKGRAAVISLARLRQEFYHMPAQAPLSLGRAMKEAVHEIGHTLGLVHCPNPLCPMSLSNTIRQVDAKSEDLCGSCSRLLEEALSDGEHDRFSTQPWRT